jgi:Flp pilus assembly protein TadB
VFRHHEKTRLVEIGDRAARAGLGLLALAITAVLALIFAVVVGTIAAAVAGALTIGLLAVLWWWFPRSVARRRAPGETSTSPPP